MKVRTDLNATDAIVANSPNDYYVDTLGRVNEVENDSDRIVFGTVANPSSAANPVDDLEKIAMETNVAGDSVTTNLIIKSIKDVVLASKKVQNVHVTMLGVILSSLEKK